MSTRILIAGWPKAGKTTLALRLASETGIVARHTDDLIGLFDWSDASSEVAKWLCEPGDWIIEGVSVWRALRKWHEAHPGEPPPFDRLICLRTPHVELTSRQVGMGKGCDSVQAELMEWLASSGVTIEERM